MLRKGAKDYSVYLKKDVPARLHYGQADDRHNHIGDIVLIPHFPHTFKVGKKIDPGQHGFDPYAVKDMHATFYAWGQTSKRS